MVKLLVDTFGAFMSRWFELSGTMYGCIFPFLKKETKKILETKKHWKQRNIYFLMILFFVSFFIKKEFYKKEFYKKEL
jgi:hypothetical protein